MRELFICTLLLILLNTTTAVYRTPTLREISIAEAPLVAAATTTTTIEPSSTTQQHETTNTAATSAAVTPIKDNGESINDAAETPGLLLPPLGGSIESAQDGLRRRIVTYDQRQEGQYNVRADLENFMIVLIPPEPQKTLGLLDLLMYSRAGQKRPGSLNAPHKLKRKHYHATTRHNGDGYLKPVRQLAHLKPIASQQQQQQQQQLQQLESGSNNLGDAAHNGAQHLSEYIEGRTPYHVDISASDEEQARLHPDRQVDVLPPAYYPHLIRPYHLEAEPTVIQALPPTEQLGSSGAGGGYNQLLDGYNQAVLNENAEKVTNTRSGSSYGNSYRASRAINGESFLETNRLGSINKINQEPITRIASVPIYRADLASGAHTNGLYPPIDAPPYITGAEDTSRTWRLVDVAAANAATEPRHLVKNLADFELDLLGDDDVDATDLVETKLLFSDGRIERCAPGHRRDSYGNCREIAGY